MNIVCSFNYCNSLEKLHLFTFYVSNILYSNNIDIFLMEI